MWLKGRRQLLPAVAQLQGTPGWSSCWPCASPILGEPQPSPGAAGASGAWDRRCSRRSLAAAGDWRALVAFHDRSEGAHSCQEGVAVDPQKPHAGFGDASGSVPCASGRRVCGLG